MAITWTHEQLARIRTSGLSDLALAIEMGCGPTTIRRIKDGRGRYGDPSSTGFNQRGSSGNNSKLSDEDRRLIRSSLDSRAALADRFGVTTQTIGNVQRGAVHR